MSSTLPKLWSSNKVYLFLGKLFEIRVSNVADHGMLSIRLSHNESKTHALQQYDTRVGIIVGFRQMATSNKTSFVTQIMPHIIHKMDSNSLVVRRCTGALSEVLERFILIQVSQLNRLRIRPFGVPRRFLQASGLLPIARNLDSEFVARTIALLRHASILHFARHLLDVARPAVQSLPTVGLKQSVLLRISRNQYFIALNDFIQWFPSLGSVVPLDHDVPLRLLPIFRLTRQRTLVIDNLLKNQTRSGLSVSRCISCSNN